MIERMTDERSAAQTSLNRVVREGVDPVLVPRGFARVGRRVTWARATPELAHVVTLDGRGRGSHVIQWGVLCDAVAAVLWGEEAGGLDVRWAVLTGTPSGIDPTCSAWVTPKQESWDSDVAALRDALVMVADYLVQFQTRRDVRDYLLQNREPKDRRGFLVPANLPLKLLVAAALATHDDDPSAETLRTEAETALAPYSDRLTGERLARLRAASATRST
jgi:hypothetical protein